MKKQSCCHKFWLSICLIFAFLLRMLANLILISLYPIVILVDILLVTFTLNFCFTEEQYAFLLIFLLMDFQTKHLCGK
jgi:hypothetical protein